MLWKYILSIRLDDTFIYKRDIHDKETHIENSEEKLLDKNTIDCEILSNMEVLKHARKC
ncbi:hypothetical protein [Clostridium beijerinckii]|uniref:hypothetical protein n=1 Tax=Clostridium beijerinckii TaxID=1520 RepID=UPI00242EED65|nr:hypothetical protein [Clostridium beijerinckii]MDG5857104.1 hypothetical protein [Clostridium beijerinckii]